MDNTEYDLEACGDDAAVRIDAWTASKLSELSRAQVQRLIEDGLVTVNSKAAKPSYRMSAGDRVHVVIPAPVPAEPLPEDIPLEIVYEDADLCVVNKPAGLVVHPAQGHETGTLVNAMLYHAKDLSGIGGVMKPGIVHRLDKGTSGLIVVCKSDRAHAGLQSQFAGREVRKTYMAIIYGSPATGAGTFDTAYGRNTSDRKKFSSKVGSVKRAITRWKVLERYRGASLVEADILTGRTHQIRVHFADAGMPLLGDIQYGASRRSRQLGSAAARRIVDSCNRVMLHAASIKFRHPATGKELSLSAPLPQDMQELLEALRKG
ncbi:MAG: RluA family pseudouridine synthase [Myxococcota bacterium]|jgi:23S rRNA pseudouridine1911/1915/1917 synthase